MNSIPKITLDNNCVINFFDRASQTSTSVDSLEELMKLSLAHKIEIAITTRVEADLENDTDESRRRGMLELINLLPVVGTVARLDVTRLDRGDVVGGEITGRLFDELQKIIFVGGLRKDSKSYQNKVNDLDHLVGHIINKRDIFVTDDKGILNKKHILKISPGILVMNPKECAEYIQEIEAKKVKIPLEIENRKIKYSSKAFSGMVSFDYSNNNGIYVIGDGFYLFETMWTRANYESIHSYSDPDSIESIALAKGFNHINEITDASVFDNSSRSRTPDEGQIIILRNKNNIFAAIKIIDVKEERKDNFDEITFEYVIQTNGTGDFSSITVSKGLRSQIKK